MRFAIDREHLKVLAVLLAAALLVGVFFVGLFHWEAQYGKVANNGEQEPESSGLYLNGVYYAPKKNLETVLLIGVDKFADQTKAQSYNNSQQADFLALLVLDRENKRHTTLHLNRDTMTQIPVLGVRGESAGSITGQLALAHRALRSQTAAVPAPRPASKASPAYCTPFRRFQYNTWALLLFEFLRNSKK